jgi:hypothetical protein
MELNLSRSKGRKEGSGEGGLAVLRDWFEKLRELAMCP